MSRGMAPDETPEWMDEVLTRHHWRCPDPRLASLACCCGRTTNYYCGRCLHRLIMAVNPFCRPCRHAQRMWEAG